MDCGASNRGHSSTTSSTASSTSSDPNYNYNHVTALVARDPPTADEAENQFVKFKSVEHFDDDFRLSQLCCDVDTAEVSKFDADEVDEDDCEEHYRRGRDCDGVHHKALVPVTKVNEKVRARDVRVKKTTIPYDAALENQLALITTSTPKYNGYQHNFITVHDEHKFLLMYTFLKRNVHNKVILYFSTTKYTQFYAKILQRLQFDVLSIHDGQSKEQFIDSFFEFSKQESGILCLSDFHGNEFATPPSVQWIVQFEPPENPSEYIFHVGHISNERSDASGRALLFLSPRECGFLQYFKAAECKIYEYEISKISNIQKNYERLIRKDGKLRKIAKEAYHAYLLSYASHEFRDVYRTRAG